MEAFRKPVIKLKNSDKKISISFARQNNSNITEIEKLNDTQLIHEWKSLVWLNEIYEQVSLNDLQRIDLIELEINERKNIDKKKLIKWYDFAKKAYEENPDSFGM